MYCHFADICFAFFFCTADTQEFGERWIRHPQSSVRKLTWYIYIYMCVCVCVLLVDVDRNIFDLRWFRIVTIILQEIGRQVLLAPHDYPAVWTELRHQGSSHRYALFSWFQAACLSPSFVFTFFISFALSLSLFLSFSLYLVSCFDPSVAHATQRGCCRGEPLLPSPEVQREREREREWEKERKKEKERERI